LYDGENPMTGRRESIIGRFRTIVTNRPKVRIIVEMPTNENRFSRRGPVNIV
jgi:hypothetical protein